jgi:hypothetical protein
MRRPLVLLSLLAFSLIVFGCGEDQPLQPGSSAVNDDAVKCQPGLDPGGYYSLSFETFAYSAFMEINKHNGRGTVAWSIGLTPEDGVSPFGLAFDLDGTMYTTLNYTDYPAENCWSQLARVDTETGEVTRIGDHFPMNTSGPEIDAHGNLYVLGFDVPHLGYIHGDRYLYRMNKATGAVTQIGYTGDDHEWMDMAFDSHGRLWGTWSNRLYRISTQTGAATLVTPIVGVPGDPPPPGYTLIQEVMSIAFDEHDVLYGTAMNVEWDTGHGSPVMRINTRTGQATLVGYTEYPYNHGGDTYPTRVRIAHRVHHDQYRLMNISIEALQAHLRHGDYVPGTVGDPNYPH